MTHLEALRIARAHRENELTAPFEKKLKKTRRCLEETEKCLARWESTSRDHLFPLLTRIMRFECAQTLIEKIYKRVEVQLRESDFSDGYVLSVRFPSYHYGQVCSINKNESCVVAPQTNEKIGCDAIRYIAVDLR
jgi:hypothetical protein